MTGHMSEDGLPTLLMFAAFGGLISVMAIRHGLKLRAERDRRES